MNDGFKTGFYQRRLSIGTGNQDLRGKRGSTGWATNEANW